jgi:hypothetical protein
LSDDSKPFVHYIILYATGLPASFEES